MTKEQLIELVRFTAGEIVAPTELSVEDAESIVDDFVDKEKLNIPAIIRSYSDKGIFIEILADGYKLEGVGICWRGYVYWSENGEWKEEDCGCFPEWIDAFETSIKFIHDWVLYNCT